MITWPAINERRSIFTSLSRWRDLNPRPLPYQGSALPLSYIGNFFCFLSGRRGSNPRPSAWKADALSTELLPQNMWVEMDSNHRSDDAADLQSAPFGHSGIYPLCYVLWASCRIRTNDPEITNHVLWPTELKRHLSLRKLTRGDLVCGCKVTTIFRTGKLFLIFFSKKFSTAVKYTTQQAITQIVIRTIRPLSVSIALHGTHYIIIYRIPARHGYQPPSTIKQLISLSWMWASALLYFNKKSTPCRQRCAGRGREISFS